MKPEIEAMDIDPKTGTTLGFYHFGLDRPNVLILSAMEGQSASCVYTNYLLMQYFESTERIDGSVSILPVANPLAFRLGMTTSPLDSQALDTVFPGSEFGTLTERLAWEIWRKVSHADYVIILKAIPFSCVSHVEALYRDYIHVRNLASQIGLPYVVQGSSQRGMLVTETAHEGIASVQINQRGFKDHVDPQASVEIRESILNFLRLKDMLPGERIETSSKFTGRYLQINASSEGFFIPQVGLGDYVSVNDVIGRIEGGEEITTAYEGTVLSLSKMNYVFEGDRIGGIATSISEQSQLEEEPTKSRRKW